MFQNQKSKEDNNFHHAGANDDDKYFHIDTLILN